MTVDYVILCFFVVVVVTNFFAAQVIVQLRNHGKW